MIAPETMAPQGPDPRKTGVAAGSGVEVHAPDRSGEPVMTLRGAGVQADVRRVGRVAIGLSLVTLAAVAIVLLVAGFQKNAEITSLRANGVPVDVTVSKCLGLMGGSGSNLVGYDCSGTYTVDGHSYTEDIPGNTMHAPGTTLRGLTVPGDPTLFSTPAAVAAEHPSWRVFLVPTVLLVTLLVLVGALVLRRRHLGAARHAHGAQ
jgi:hypothetical protein